MNAYKYDFSLLPGFKQKLDCLTVNKVKQFEFISNTPANGIAYYDKELDIAVVVYHKTIRIFFNRRMEGKKPCCFDCVYEITDNTV